MTLKKALENVKKWEYDLNTRVAALRLLNEHVNVLYDFADQVDDQFNPYKNYHQDLYDLTYHSTRKCEIELLDTYEFEITKVIEFYGEVDTITISYKSSDLNVEEFVEGLQNDFLDEIQKYLIECD